MSKLINAPSTSKIFGSDALGESSTALLDNCRIRKAITDAKKRKYEHGTDWEGLVHYIANVHNKLPQSERYIHAVINKGFQIVVTMHPEMAQRLHHVWYVEMDYTFSRVHSSERMDKWEIAGFLDFVNKCYMFGSLFCDTKSTQAYEQIWSKFFDVIQRLTGRLFKLAPFYPDAKCRVILLDGEVAQAQALGTFLVKYNNPNISSIRSRDPLEMLSYTLKTCSVHFNQHANLDPQLQLPSGLLGISQSWNGLFPLILFKNCAIIVISQAPWRSRYSEVEALISPYPAALNWFKQKQANPWILRSLNQVASNIAFEDYNTTPHHTNLIESAHAACKRETEKRVGLLDAILDAWRRDNAHAVNLAQMERSGVLHKRNNDTYHREVNSAQRAKWAWQLAAQHSLQTQDFLSLKAELADGNTELAASLARSKELKAEMDHVKAQLGLDRHGKHFAIQLDELRAKIS
ncbi:unnamed protein product [Mycena citricolor]|uniref:Uncharacterized protein n=1 Tax=Mycena citricolor TaxID=2018698 RepID=A0AAD2Q1J5_9AGAR|nr:unnamed protein product [Mycena citricolor]